MLASIGIYFQSQKWIDRKKENGELGSYDKGNVIPRDWLLIICFGAIGIVYLMKGLFSL